ncbi:HAD family phosphatase [Mucilaginibacter limnophilus]|uniref:HAD family phosphatase n=1 Tax=Mucilaginibacter limnophilus TaxID=1932778 RepID=A0A437MS72_9SPHI|nr:HAD family phosphatase [Mucilaginibacter limnophilus]RVU00445.1 HAD family phosphatase [Mucilaginibacter limnophilus]
MINTIIFDLGAVLIDWNPQYLYRKIFADEQEMQTFLSTICTPEWNEEQDAGRSLQEGADFLVTKFPDHAENIRAFYGRWEEMLGGAIDDTVEIFKQLKDSGKYKIYALTNWSAETFEIAKAKYDFLDWFDGIVISGVERTRKPFPEFYQILLDRYNIKSEEALFIDDNHRNIVAAEALGMNAVHFTSASELKHQLAILNVSI